ncbi:hypothetical protein HPB48_023586 [Haemaphysalis longicornis]|uniref:Uncharacterized protein n=1 Tax=Haemaphysalis longicornis TaxID=44386 RepID=A0A9J6GWU4_HAELO|nr:hypothetical protein HPB48_023586 [Haemaphysalis longicornis]
MPTAWPQLHKPGHQLLSGHPVALLRESIEQGEGISSGKEETPEAQSPQVTAGNNQRLKTLKPDEQKAENLVNSPKTSAQICLHTQNIYHLKERCTEKTTFMA